MSKKRSLFERLLLAVVTGFTRKDESLGGFPEKTLRKLRRDVERSVTISTRCERVGKQLLLMPHSLGEIPEIIGKRVCKRVEPKR